ncbi:translation initiation factor IF-3 [Clostridia bacterium]|nr:translation initiation factor IF-3 [Clostridia bacterium]
MGGGALKSKGKPANPINDEIRGSEYNELRVVGPDSEALGIMQRTEAQALADSKNLDLVLIAPQGNPPVARVMDYGKFRFEQTKKEKAQKSAQKQIELKEVRLSLNIDQNDLSTKIAHANSFLEKGDKVKLTIRFKGREVTHVSLGEKLIERFEEGCAEFGIPEKSPKLEGRNFTVIMQPKNKKQ